MRLRKIWNGAPALLFAFASMAALAQGRVEEKEWKEADAPPPPSFEVSRLIPFEVSAGSSLKFGVDPSTLAIGADGVLRYVMVARSPSGTVNAMYEGLRCSTGEYKTYARYNASGGWNAVSDPKWEPLRGSGRSMYTFQMARQGACPDGGTPVRLDEVLRELRRPSYIKSDHN